MYKQGKCVYLFGLVNELIEEQGIFFLVQTKEKKIQFLYFYARTSPK